MSEPARRILVVGAGLAGLCCARTLHAAGHRVTVFESSSRPGGRVASDRVDGFTLDRGFQVLNTAYREAASELDFGRLELRPFPSAAASYARGRFRTLAHPLRHPSRAATSLVGGLVTPATVRAMLPLLVEAMSSRDDHPASTGETVEAFLKEKGVPGPFVDGFVRPFFGGTFLDRSLRTDAGRFRWLLAMFAQGRVTVPAAGMGAIPRQLAAGLPKGTIRYGTPVVAVSAHEVRLDDGRREQGDAVVVATDGSTAARLLPGWPDPTWCRTVTVWFATPAEVPGPGRDGTLLLNGGRTGPVNHAACLSAVAPEYAPRGRGLFAANVVGAGADRRSGVASDVELVGEVRRQLEIWFGRGTLRNWEPLRVDLISHALPRQHPSDLVLGRPRRRREVFVAGDHVDDASINGAMRSGRLAAEAVIDSFRVG
jgi:phytoene dehydrogenase-like protein